MEKLSSVFFYHLEKAIKTYRQYAQARLKAEGFGITIDQWLVLKALGDSPDATQNELAEAVFKDKASVTRIIDILVSEGYLDRAVNGENRRRHKLSITKKGRQLLKAIQPTILKNRATALKDISEANVRVTEKVLKAIAANCSK